MSSNTRSAASRAAIDYENPLLGVTPGDTIGNVRNALAAIGRISFRDGLGDFAAPGVELLLDVCVVALDLEAARVRDRDIAMSQRRFKGRTA